MRCARHILKFFGAQDQAIQSISSILQSAKAAKKIQIGMYFGLVFPITHCLKIALNML
jgi:hypothetical protein